MFTTEVTESLMATVQSAARKLTGWRRRQFQAEMAVKYCEGSARRAEAVFGWGRAAIHTGLNELRTGIRCVDSVSLRGRKKTELQNPELVRKIHAIVEPHSQADPKFQTPLAYTRITAKAVRKELRANSVDTDHLVPAERTMHDILNRLGYRLRRVRKTKPQKNSQPQKQSSSTCGESTLKPRLTRKRYESRSIPRPK
jgi:Rhodopirellula transposase DDE domain